MLIIIQQFDKRVLVIYPKPGASFYYGGGSSQLSRMRSIIEDQENEAIHETIKSSVPAGRAWP